MPSDSLLRRPHFLHISRHHTFDISTVAAADYDVDVHSGFMPPQEPVARLLGEYEAWEDLLDHAIGKLKLAGDAFATVQDREYIACWRQKVRELPIVDADPLYKDERALRRAHVVLSYLTHLYVHSVTHSPSCPISIPQSLSIPLVSVSRELGIPPILTYADTIDPSLPVGPNNIRSVTNITGTGDEDHFYMTSARIELRGVEALTLMRATLDETFLSDALTITRVSTYLTRLAGVIDDISALLMSVRQDCDPDVFYNQFRPWINGGTAHPSGWNFDGFAKLSGPSAGQSSLVHALDIFLGVEHPPHGSSESTENPTHPSPSFRPSTSSGMFLQKQLLYMPRHHRAFLSYLSKHVDQPKLKEAYNSAVDALKRFRDGHIRIVTLYIIAQAKGNVDPSSLFSSAAVQSGEEAKGPRGSGGTLLVPFLKSIRDNTSRTFIHRGA
ncbi:Indoleamine 2,3-dioxygenase [Cantharellus anzutake]|uniref:Indoleamine 2,3-dioxygenase n=1 Tax=Cantharellus anzutake TaxID=1750568 RepID=UPI0019044BAB|nr:Indoleamine 2,3-dioxygenase [Cantharellus anzutake]KAF8340479.1 Indoleamine 2,3-dioxygenase [Cantharellus anzutake]